MEMIRSDLHVRIEPDIPIDPASTRSKSATTRASASGRWRHRRVTADRQTVTGPR